MKENREIEIVVRQESEEVRQHGRFLMGLKY